MTLAVLCPGQGGQQPAMFDLVETEADAGSLIDAANVAAGFDVVAATTQGPSMFDNAIAQPLICAFQGIVWSLLAPRLATVGVIASVCAGYSVGELASHVCAGRLSWIDAVRLARARAEAMDRASRPGQGLAAVRGLSHPVLEGMLGECFMAIVNGDDHCIVGGESVALDALAAAVTTRGASFQRLPVGVAAHTPLLAAAVAPFRIRLAQTDWTASTVPTIAGIDGSAVRDRERAVDTLARQIAEPVRWSDCMDALVERGATTCLELGPGNALSRMMRERHPDLACRSTSDFRSIAAVVDWAAR